MPLITYLTTSWRTQVLLPFASGLFLALGAAGCADGNLTSASANNPLEGIVDTSSVQSFLGDPANRPSLQRVQSLRAMRMEAILDQALKTLPKGYSLTIGGQRINDLPAMLEGVRRSVAAMDARYGTYGGFLDGIAGHTQEVSAENLSKAFAQGMAGLNGGHSLSLGDGSLDLTTDTLRTCEANAQDWVARQTGNHNARSSADPTQAYTYPSGHSAKAGSPLYASSVVLTFGGTAYSYNCEAHGNQVSGHAFAGDEVSAGSDAYSMAKQNCYATRGLGDAVCQNQIQSVPTTASNPVGPNGT